MTAHVSSSHKVPYDLRPRKQVERRMMAHVFQLLGESGFPISTYRYAGFGAFFFVDFILFRRLLAITDMVSIERDSDNENRVRFNCPYKDINVIIQTSFEYISEMSREKPHILWLDYDGPIEQDQLVDIETAASKISAGSILIATIDVDFDKADIRIREFAPSERAREWHKRFKEECGNLLDPTLKSSDFNASEIPKRAIEIVKGAILSGLSMREGISFEPLFNFQYADGHEMLTIGGIICSKLEKRKLRQIEWETELYFAWRDFSSPPFRIEVPVLTRKERLLIDSHMPCDPEWIPEEFEIELETIRSYRKVYRYCPLYAELLL